MARKSKVAQLLSQTVQSFKCQEKLSSCPAHPPLHLIGELIPCYGHVVYMDKIKLIFDSLGFPRICSVNDFCRFSMENHQVGENPDSASIRLI